MHEKGPEVQRREESLGAGESEEGFFFFFLEVMLLLPACDQNL